MSNDTRSRPYNASGSLSEYGVFPECDAQPPADNEFMTLKRFIELELAKIEPQWTAKGKGSYWWGVKIGLETVLAKLCEMDGTVMVNAPQPEHRRYDPYGSLSEYDVFPECDAPQPAGNGCHCATCTCDPNMTPAVRFDLSPAQPEGAIREHLIRLGWTPPADLLQPAEGEEIMVSTPYDAFTLPLHPSGLPSGPRFVVHVPGPEEPAWVEGISEDDIATIARQAGLWLEKEDAEGEPTEDWQLLDRAGENMFPVLVKFAWKIAALAAKQTGGDLL